MTYTLSRFPEQCVQVGPRSESHRDEVRPRVPEQSLFALKTMM